MTEKRPISQGLFTWPSSSPELIGSRCVSCGEHFFPVQRTCTLCSSTDTEIVELGSEGRLWTWTIQGFMPKPPFNSGETPESFQPFGVGYIEMPSGVKVEARLIENLPEQLRIGMRMKLVVAPFRTDATGNEVLGFAFKSLEGREGDV